MIRSNRFIGGLILLLTCFSYSLVGVAEHRELRVTAFNSQPWGFVDEKGVTQGIIPEWIAALIGELHIKYTLSLANVSRIVADLRNGNTDMTVLLRSSMLLEVADCLGEVAYVRSVAVGRKGTDLNSIADLQSLPRKIGQVRGAKYGKRYDEDGSIEKFNAESYQQIIRMLFKERIDAVVGTEAALYRAAKEIGFGRDMFGKAWVVSEKPLCLFVSKRTLQDQPDLRDTLGHSIDRLHEAGVLQTIEQSWTDR